jgi:hypothetical protein
VGRGEGRSLLVEEDVIIAMHLNPSSHPFGSPGLGGPESHLPSAPADSRSHPQSIELVGQLAAITAENRELRMELDRARGERAKLIEIQQRIMDLLGTKAPEKIVHDIRNVMNERELFRSLADAQM